MPVSPFGNVFQQQYYQALDMYRMSPLQQAVGLAKNGLQHGMMLDQQFSQALGIPSLADTSTFSQDLRKNELFEMMPAVGGNAQGIPPGLNAGFGGQLPFLVPPAVASNGPVSSGISAQPAQQQQGAPAPAAAAANGSSQPAEPEPRRAANREEGAAPQRNNNRNGNRTNRSSDRNRQQDTAFQRLMNRKDAQDVVTRRERGDRSTRAPGGNRENQTQRAERGFSAGTMGPAALSTTNILTNSSAQGFLAENAGELSRTIQQASQPVQSGTQRLDPNDPDVLKAGNVLVKGNQIETGIGFLDNGTFDPETGSLEVNKLDQFNFINSASGQNALQELNDPYLRDLIPGVTQELQGTIAYSAAQAEQQ